MSSPVRPLARSLAVDSGDSSSDSPIFVSSRSQPPSVNDIAQSVFIQGETTLRYTVLGSGDTRWSDGTAANDVRLFRSAAGRLQIGALPSGVLGEVEMGKILLDNAGGDASTGTATLVAGTVTVATTRVTASSIIQVTRNTPGGVVGDLSVPVASIVAATSFVINSANVGDTSTVNWTLVN